MSTPVHYSPHWQSINIGYMEAARIRLQLDEPALPLQQHLANFEKLQTLLAQVGEEIRYVSDKHMHRQYTSLLFQVDLLGSQIGRIRAKNLGATQPLLPTIGGTLCQYSVKKEGHVVGAGACTYCAISAIKQLWQPIMSGQLITPEMIDRTVREGVADSPVDQNYGDFLGLIFQRDNEGFRLLYNQEGSPVLSGLQNQRKGCEEGISKLYTLAQQNGGYLSAGCTFNPMSYALFINAKTNTFYFYDSHGDTADPTTGATPETGAKAFIKVFNNIQHLIAYINQRHPFNPEHGDSNDLVTYPDGTQVPNQNAYQIVPLSLLPEQELAPPPNSRDDDSKEDDEEMALRLHREEEGRAAQVAEDARLAREWQALECTAAPQPQAARALPKPPQSQNREFVGIKELKRKLIKTYEKLLEKAKNPTWKLIADGRVKDGLHFDWFGFPIKERSARHGRKFEVNGAIIEELKLDPEYMDYYRKVVALVMRSWGWDLARNVKDENEQKWSGCSVRLYKMRRSLAEFRQSDLLDQINAWALEHAPKEGIYRPRS